MLDFGLLMSSYVLPFIRGREFYWIEAHDAFASEKEALDQVKEDMEVTRKVLFEELCIPFLFFRRPQHDKFKGAVDTYAADTLMPDGRALQLPSTHFLGQNFSKVFDIKFVDENGEEKYVWQTCYGPAFWRIMGALIAIHGDDKGLVLPPSVAPLQVVIVPIYGDEDKKVVKKCEDVEKMLKENGVRVFLDKRRRYTPGWKYNYWELKGVPLRIEIGKREVENRTVVIVRRDNGEKIEVKDKKLVDSVKELLGKVQEDMRKKAERSMEERIFVARNMDELKEYVGRGFVVVNWCGRKECADYIKSETEGGSIRGTLFEKKEKVFGKCVWCGRKAKEVVYVAKSY